MKNLKEFKALIKQYKSITLEDLKAHYEPNKIINSLKSITGFGNLANCTLCKAVSETGFTRDVDCSKCVYGIEEDQDEDLFCIKGSHKKSYDTINNARTYTELLSAIKKRADHMKRFFKKT